MEAAAKTFFSSPRFGVAGASQNTHKFGYKGTTTIFTTLTLLNWSDIVAVLAWYHGRSLSVQPVTPSRPSIKISSTTYQTVPSPSALPFPSETSLSIITQPSVTLQVLREAKEAGIPAVWLQPGSFDDEGLEYAKREFKAGGMGGEGWCVLVDGDTAWNMAREEEKEKL